MDDRGKRLEALYHKALELAEEERHDFLTRACGEDQELRRDVASLLRYDDSTIDASGFYPTQGVLSGTIGNRFKVRRRLGRVAWAKFTWLTTRN